MQLLAKQKRHQIFATKLIGIVANEDLETILGKIDENNRRAFGKDRNLTIYRRHDGEKLKGFISGCSKLLFFLMTCFIYRTGHRCVQNSTLAEWDFSKNMLSDNSDDMVEKS